ncbi:hypothetical protein C8034_v005066 [Colletotrichum sidae]|uniref:Uncharacterized protein n=1 Tax=Colletotrichum sidae TaxID=1347389 RepID=A0A4R8SNB5_9PEZI|nr:hypothetical protein C8034_v005066 [Colletotrichum sidae]
MACQASAGNAHAESSSARKVGLGSWTRRRRFRSVARMMGKGTDEIRGQQSSESRIASCFGLDDTTSRARDGEESSIRELPSRRQHVWRVSFVPNHLTRSPAQPGMGIQVVGDKGYRWVGGLKPLALVPFKEQTVKVNVFGAQLSAAVFRSTQ